MRRPSRSSSPFGGAPPSDDDARAAAEFFALRPWLLEQPPSTAVPTLGSIEEVYATLPWLGEAPPKPTGPEPGSWEEVIALKPWLAWGEVEPSGSEPGSWEEVLVLKPWLGAQGELPGIDFDGIEGIDIDAGAPSEVTFGVRPIYRRRQPYALLGVNAPKVLLSDGIDAEPNKSTYGSTDTILGDLESLGATVLRQPIRAEMVWHAGAEVPAVADGQAMYVDRFQAREVWRRLAAAATVSRYVCWHTHMSILTLPPDTTGFGYLGLRTDSGLPAHYEHGVYTVVSPNDVEQRLSWWAYHRFASLAFEHGDVRHIIARFVKPLPATAAYYQDSTISFSDIDYVGIVIEFTSGTRTSKVYNYLVMIDPVAPLYTSSFIRLSTSDGSTQTIEQWDTIPPEDTSTYTPVAAPTDGLSFPSSAPPAAWDSPTLTISSTSFPPPSDAPLVVTVDADPILIRCRQPLVVAWS